MTDKQPEALAKKLAKALEFDDFISVKLLRQAATLLRTQHKKIAAYELLTKSQEAQLSHHREQSDKYREANSARAHLADQIVGLLTGKEAAPPAQQPQYEAGDMASAAAQGFRDGVASVAQQPQAEAVHNKPVRVCHIKDVACSEAAVKCGECPDAAPPQAEAVTPTHVLVPKRMTKAMEYVTEQEDWTWGDLLAAAEAITEAEYSEMAQAEAVPSDVVLVPVDVLHDWKSRVNTLATLSTKSERYAFGIKLKQDIADAAQGEKP